MAGHESRAQPQPQPQPQPPLMSAAITTFLMELSNHEDIPQPLASKVRSILHVANAVQNQRPRFAYLCWDCAYKKISQMDLNFVRKFKASFYGHLKQDRKSSQPSRVMETDLGEIESFYKQYYEYVTALEKEEQAHRTQLSHTYKIAEVLHEIFLAVNCGRKVAPEILEADRYVKETKETSAPFNILSLDSTGASQAMMWFEKAYFPQKKKAL